ncbi:MAG: hypothetical protein QOE77_2713 [Blastocatellia bacterium]|jgi:hypothetical protein|nr:hypothetical protein [Blastocatellia bacterium]
MRLPNAKNAVVDIEKLRNYCLNPDHPEGKHKARVFREKLGFTDKDAERLRQLILEAILTTEATEQDRTVYGQRFVVDFPVRVDEQLSFVLSWVTIRSAWIIKDGEEFARLTTCFIR